MSHNLYLLEPEETPPRGCKCGKCPMLAEKAHLSLSVHLGSRPLGEGDRCELKGRPAFRLVVKVASELDRKGEETFFKKLHKICQIRKQSEECEGRLKNQIQAHDGARIKTRTRPSMRKQARAKILRGLKDSLGSGSQVPGP